MLGTATNNIRRRTPALILLPAAASCTFGDRPPWSVISTKTLTTALGLDAGLFGCWRYRGIAPAELPFGWFRRASGNPCRYLVADVLGWLAARHRQPYDPAAAMFDAAEKLLGPGCGTPAMVWLLAEMAGPVQGNVRFTASGFRAYLEMLSSTVNTRSSGA